MPTNEHPLTGFRFSLELGAIQVAGFSECSGLQLEAKVYEYKEGGRNSSSLKFPDTGTVGNITLKRGITTGANSNALFKWQLDVMSGTFDKNTNPNKRNFDPDKDSDKMCSIVLYDELKNEVKRWNLRRAFPVKWRGPDFRSTTNEIAIETLELACEGIELQEK